MWRVSIFSEAKSNLNHTALGVHRLDNGKKVQWDTSVAHAFSQGTTGGLVMSYHFTGQGNENFTTLLI